MAAGCHTVLRLPPYELSLRQAELIWVSVERKVGKYTNLVQIINISGRRDSKKVKKTRGSVLVNM